MINVINWCYSQLNELQKYKTPKNILLENRIKERLDKSYQSYTKELNASLDYLQRRNELNVIKKLNRMNKQK